MAREVMVMSDVRCRAIPFPRVLPWAGIARLCQSPERKRRVCPRPRACAWGSDSSADSVPHALTALIPHESGGSAAADLDYSDAWTEQDLVDVAAHSTRHAAEVYPLEDDLV
jgi:hypothetical protein